MDMLTVIYMLALSIEICQAGWLGKISVVFEKRNVDICQTLLPLSLSQVKLSVRTYKLGPAAGKLR